MGTFMQKYERVAVKYAAYVEAKLAFSSSIPMPIEFDMTLCKLILWGLED